MIAQGEFRELLKADTDKRITLFRDLFSTMNYGRLQDRLALDAADQKRICDEHRRTIREALRNVECAVSSSAEGSIAALREDALPPAEADSIIAALIADDETAEAAANTRMTALEKAAAVLTRQQDQAMHRLELMQHLKQTETLISLDTVRIKNTEQALPAARDHQEEALRCNAETTALEAHMADYDRPDNIQNECQTLCAAVRKTEADSVS